MKKLEIIIKPEKLEDLKEVLMKNPGKFTYPALPDFTASAFVRNVIYDIVGYENVKNVEADEEKVKEGAIQGYVAALNDPYTVYIPKEEMEAAGYGDYVALLD